ncbi:DUF3558 domain-containing protein [Kribbella sp. NBC_01505]|uniref:DUF3558 family protein n=1 Tax=Kribbella sp. NBC_01505 TaxID=2903580 RepID=UPI003864208F
MVKNVVRPLLVLAASAVLLAGCGDKEANTAAPAASSSGGPSIADSLAPDSAPTPTTSSPPSSEKIDACTLIKGADYAKYGKFLPVSRSTTGSARSCNYVRNASNGNGPMLDILSFGVGVRDKQGIDTMNDNGGGLKPGTVNGRRSVEAATPGYSCAIGLELGPTSRVDVVVISPGPGTACKLAQQSAQLVEPRIPK